MTDIIGFAKELELLKKSTKPVIGLFNSSFFDYENFFLKDLYFIPTLKKEREKAKKLFDKYFKDVTNEEMLIIKDILLLKLNLEAYRKEFYKYFDHNRWLKENCPLCGNKPAIGFIIEDGFRYLQCGICDMRWRFRRVVCPYCREEGGSYDLFNFNETNVRADYCESCKGYIKIFFQMSDEFGYELDVKTLFIDEYAQRRGYKKCTNYLLGINFEFN